MVTRMPAVTPGSDFGAEGNRCPLLLQAPGLGHPSQPRLGGWRCHGRQVCGACEVCGLDVVTCPSRSILPLCLTRTPSPSLPCSPGLCRVGCLCPAWTTPEPPWDGGSGTSWDRAGCAVCPTFPQPPRPCCFQSGRGWFGAHSCLPTATHHSKPSHLVGTDPSPLEGAPFSVFLPGKDLESLSWGRQCYSLPAGSKLPCTLLPTASAVGDRTVSIPSRLTHDISLEEFEDEDLSEITDECGISLHCKESLATRVSAMGMRTGRACAGGAGRTIRSHAGPPGPQASDASSRRPLPRRQSPQVGSALSSPRHSAGPF